MYNNCTHTHSTGEELTTVPADPSPPQAQAKPKEEPIPVLALPPSVVEPVPVAGVTQGVGGIKVTLVPTDKPKTVCVCVCAHKLENMEYFILSMHLC